MKNLHNAQKELYFFIDFVLTIIQGIYEMRRPLRPNPKPDRCHPLVSFKFSSLNLPRTNWFDEKMLGVGNIWTMGVSPHSGGCQRMGVGSPLQKF